LDVLLVKDCRFIDPHTLSITTTDHSALSNLTARHFLISTGASPVVPEKLQRSADRAGLRLSTYRSLLSPEGQDPIWNLLAESDGRKTGRSNETARLLIAGGGATACELGQSLMRLFQSTASSTNSATSIPRVHIDFVAPALLPDEDVRLQEAALRILTQTAGDCFCTVQLHLGRRMDDILHDKGILLDDDTVLPPVDAALLCLGRSPEKSLRSLQLDKAGVKWSSKGIYVDPHTLQSMSAKHVYAAGDCCQAISPRMRTASQAAWTGFHAIRNMRLLDILPRRFLFLGRGWDHSIHPTIPRVVYTDPEMACVGLTYRECVERYGDGFDWLCIPEQGTDRADMERIERSSGACFVELRADKAGGRILGCTACGPAAAELANSMGVAITNSLTIADVARSAHSYPSYGYLLHRIALSMAFSNVWGLLEASGPLGKAFARVGRFGSNAASRWRSLCRLPRKRRKLRHLRQWQVVGAGKTLYLGNTTKSGEVDVVSFLGVSSNETLRRKIEYLASPSSSPVLPTVVLPSRKEAQECLDWLQTRP
jgi:pyruvate/2-oxoglutarate dehydrogenase complex dihydrolipoamide dehydrogenase (E3) component